MCECNFIARNEIFNYINASEEILKREVNEQDNTRIVNDFIKEIK